MSNVSESEAASFAIRAHGAQRYGNQPYATHLIAVTENLRRFGVATPEGRRAAAFALATGVWIAGYTLVDAMGVRRSGTTLGYIVWRPAVAAGPRGRRSALGADPDGARVGGLHAPARQRSLLRPGGTRPSGQPRADHPRALRAPYLRCSQQNRRTVRRAITLHGRVRLQLLSPGGEVRR